MTTTTTNNGQPRKSLATQLDRLDGILDGLAEALNQSVAAAVQASLGQAVREAVQATLSEVLNNASALALLQPAPALPLAVTLPTPPAPVPEPTPQPSLRAWLGERWLELCSWLTHKRQQLHSAATKLWSWLGPRLGLLLHVWPQLLLALLVGVAAGTLAWFAEPWLAGVLSGLGAFVTAAVVQAGLWLRRVLNLDDSPA